MILQFCGLSGAGKSTLAKLVREKLSRKGYIVEILDGDEYRQTLCCDLGFSKEDRKENLRRMAFVAAQLSKHGIITIICAINPYEATREEIRNAYSNVKTIHIDCSLATLINRDTKGLYRKALLPDAHPEKISNLTGVNDPFEVPKDADLYVNTDHYNIGECAHQIASFTEKHFVLCTEMESKVVTNVIPLTSYQSSVI
ncbi:adenylyl-sulfate kinase [Chitinophagaceae bacterium LB-8]|uniref:Adenylyl-sulfate kinase n=1 Tax=Paraflavisolibacter caeni TaxID=2982496 RepID=A0A9X3B7N7_9BACT|nr:adenylyl-sulfate kinase [Paraflavisolibacter caeni]MCU7548676.1 adenylyl-sulfate kinase [Paraflavisolibacter caeni]